MSLHVLVGDDVDAVDSVRKTLLANAEWVENIDCALDNGDQLIAAVCVPSMFGGTRYVSADAFESVSDDNLARLGDVLDGADVVVVARTASLTAAKLKKLPKTTDVQKLAIPRGRDVVGRIAEIAREEGVQLSSSQQRMMAERLEGDLQRVRSICWQLAMVGAVKPQDRQVITLLGTRDSDGVPWQVTDALEAGDLPAALRAAGELEAMPVLAYLMNLVSSAGRVIDAGAKTPADVETLLGQKSFQARKTLDLTNRLGVDGVALAWQALARAEARAKSSVGQEAALTLAVSTLSVLWARSRS